MQKCRQFASDNYAGITPEAWAAMTEANSGHAASYGDDPWTRGAVDAICEVFETRCEVFFVFNGTAANSLSLAHLCKPYHTLLCHEVAHVETAECGAPAFFSGGAKIIPVGGAGGKMDVDQLLRAARRRNDVHFQKPGALCLTQAAETGVVYTPEEVRALAGAAKRLEIPVQMDGARFANAVASLGVAPADITWRAGVDVLCLGGSKNGLGLGEVVVFFDSMLARDFSHRIKQGGQLASKMRFLSAPWLASLREGAWLRHAAHANAMARRLEAGLRTVPGVKVAYPVETNAVFAEIPEELEKRLHARGWHFYTGVVTPESRLMCSWDTTPGDVDDFVLELKSALNP